MDACVAAVFNNLVKNLEFVCQEPGGVLEFIDRMKGSSGLPPGFLAYRSAYT